MREHRGSREFYSGKLNERDMLGEYRPTAEYIRKYKELSKDGKYLPYRQSMDLVREYHQEDPTNPSKPFANELRLSIAEELGLETEQDMDRLKFFSAVNSGSLDFHHGVDAWIELLPKDKSERSAIVTMDVTLRETVGKSDKADVIIGQVPDPSEDEKKFMKLVYEEYGPDIAGQIQQQI